MIKGEHQSFRLAHLIRESVQTYQKRALAAGVEIRIVNDFVFDILLLADLRKLKTLFGLVIRNAIDHSGATTITFSSRQLLYFQNHVLLEFCLTDNGRLGKRSFAYYRSLIRIRRMVEELHGKSESLIEPGMNSNLKFIIRSQWQHTEDLLTQLSTASSSSSLKGKCLLVADANEINQMLLRQVLQKEGAEVDVAGDGIETIRMLERKKYDVLFLDLHMPHMDGFQTANYIRKNLRDPVVMIALSAVADCLITQVQCGDAGFEQMLMKPLNLNSDPLSGWMKGLIGEHSNIEVPHSYNEFGRLRKKDRKRLVLSEMKISYQLRKQIDET